MNEQAREATRQWTLAVPTVSAFVSSLVRDSQDRDDILQETAVAVIESFGRYDASQSFVGWAIGIAKNQTRAHLRRKNREKIAFDSEAIQLLARAFEGDGMPDRRLEHLGDCFDSLDARSQELCRWRYEQDRKPLEISERIGVTSNVVAKSLQRIRDRLRECMERKASAEGLR